MVSLEFLTVKKVYKSPFVINPGNSKKSWTGLLNKEALGECLERERTSFPRLYFVVWIIYTQHERCCAGKPELVKSLSIVGSICVGLLLRWELWSQSYRSSFRRFSAFSQQVQTLLLRHYFIVAKYGDARNQNWLPKSCCSRKVFVSQKFWPSRLFRFSIFPQPHDFCLRALQAVFGFRADHLSCLGMIWWH